jgi:hypothetical protein
MITSIPQLFSLEKDAEYGFIGKMLDVIAPHTESSPVSLVSQFVALFGNVVGHSPYIMVENNKERCKVFLCLVGRSSKGRKGTSLNHVKDLVFSATDEWYQKNIVKGVNSAEGLIARLNRSSHKNALIYEPEFSRLLSTFKRSGNTASAIIRDAFDTDCLCITRNEELFVDGVHISVIGHITEDELRRTLDSVDVWNGFANRFAFCYTNRVRLLPGGGHIDPERLKQLKHELRDIIEYASEVREIKRSPEAEELWEKIYYEVSVESVGILDAVLSRSEIIITRLACIYALLDRTDVIRPEHLNAAYALWRYFQKSSIYLFGGADPESMKDVVCKLIYDHADGISKTDINKEFSGHANNKRLNSVLDELVAEGLIILENLPTKGRSKSIYKPNPETEDTIDD